MYFKIWWFLRAIVYKLFFKNIGLPSYIGRPIFLLGVGNIYIGKRVRIYPHVRMETHQGGKIIINENVSIAQNVHITSAGDLVIGSSSTILANVFITNIDHDYQEIGVHVLDQKYLVKETAIGENCYIGIGACLQAGTVLGKQCVVGANAVVRGIFPDYSVIAGVPAKIVKRYDPETKTWAKTHADGSLIN